MDLAKPGLIQRFCQPNAMVTFREYLEDYATPETKQAGLKAINQHLSEMKDEKLLTKVKSQLARVEQGERDLYN